MSEADGLASERETVSDRALYDEITRIQAAIAPGNDGDKEDLITYAKGVERLRKALERAEAAMSCGPSGERTCYCPNCDGGFHDAREDIRAALNPEGND